MKRSQVLLSILAAALVIALFYVLLLSPAREDLAELEEQIAAQQTQQQQLQQEITRLRAVRDEAPEVEAELATAEAIVPRDAALPSALRQLQVAADESGVVLQSVSTSRPTAVDNAPAGLSNISANVQLFGGYFQVVDFLRRVEDPAITPRGLTWSNATLGLGSEYPELNVSLTGSLYALIVVPPAPEAAVPDAPDGEDGEGSDGDGADDADDAEATT